LFKNLPKIKYFLAYVNRSIGLKGKTMESDDKREKTKKYEENRKAPKFNVKWLTNREWLDYDESNDIMTCKGGNSNSMCITNTRSQTWLTGNNDNITI
jgi:hypothetical protein